MLGAVVCFGVMVLFVKLLREAGMSTPEVMAWRMAPGVPVAALLLWRRGRPWTSARPRELTGRVVFGGLAMGTYFWAIPHLSLFTNTSLALTQPVFVAMLAPLLLGERSTAATKAAFVLALGGTALVVVGRESGVATVGAVLPMVPIAVRLTSAVSSATAHIFIRRTTRVRADRPGDAPDTVVLHFAGWVSLACIVWGLATDQLHGLPDSLPSHHAVLYIVGMSGAGVAGQLMLSRAYARGRAPAVAVMGYVAIPMSLGLDAWVWNVGVQPFQLAGVVLTAGAGLLLLRRSA